MRVIPASGLIVSTGPAACVTTTPMTDRQRGYRDTYRARIVGWYTGYIHIAVIYVIGVTAM